jgi:hypothetical protein
MYSTMFSVTVRNMPIIPNMQDIMLATPTLRVRQPKVCGPIPSMGKRPFSYLESRPAMCLPHSPIQWKQKGGGVGWGASYPLDRKQTTHLPSVRCRTTTPVYARTAYTLKTLLYFTGRLDGLPSQTMHHNHTHIMP